MQRCLENTKDTWLGLLCGTFAFLFHCFLFCLMLASALEVVCAQGSRAMLGTGGLPVSSSSVLGGSFCTPRWVLGCVDSWEEAEGPPGWTWFSLSCSAVSGVNDEGLPGSPPVPLGPSLTAAHDSHPLGGRPRPHVLLLRGLAATFLGFQAGLPSWPTSAVGVTCVSWEESPGPGANLLDRRTP